MVDLSILRRALLGVVPTLLVAAPVLAQCPADDAAEPNDTCGTPSALPGAGSYPNLVVTNNSDDYWSITVPPGMDCTVDVLFIDAQIDIDVTVYDASNCTTILTQAGSATDNEQVTFTNFGASPLNAVIWIENYLNLAACGDYGMVVSIVTSTNPCAGLPDDVLEPNDSCGAPSVQSAGTVGTGLYVIKNDDDYYRVTVPGNMALQVDALFFHSSGDLDVEIFDATCSNLLTSSETVTDNEQAVADNMSASPVDMIVHVYVWSGSAQDCNNYDLIFTILNPVCNVPDDSFEENDTCATAAPIAPGMYSNLFVRKDGVDNDFYAIVVPAGATINCDVLFTHANGDIDAALYDSCSTAAVDTSQGTIDNEQVAAMNATAAPVTYFLEVYVWAAANLDCNTYGLNITVTGGGSPYSAFCFGDGSGTACPCGNNSTAGHGGGCAHQNGNGAILTGSGVPSVGADTMHFDLTSGPFSTFAVLVSGNNRLPQTGPCIGCGNHAFDGLRCAGGNFQRHGSRSVNASGNANNGWGPPAGPAGGLIAQGGFTSGQTRHFFAFVRTDALQTCMMGQNSTNGVSVTMVN